MPFIGVGGSEGEIGYQKPCRACNDFKSWAKIQRGNYNAGATPQKSENNSTDHRDDCPLDKDELGRKTWGFLHTMAAYYPEKPTEKQSKDMKHFFNIFSNFYPCDHCASDFRQDLVKNPPKTASQSELSKWLCDMHNIVNLKLGKPKFDCTKVNERWRDGWLDGSCDS
ncbi:evr1_Alr domain-containing protein Alr [Arctopsyche grandis]|uniref:evr1_Alr domain-containing protein Alr n=1 Tax=Arctopsyche grandis TaxID=121162 RepID=UPI00406D664A